jgi:TetR/AcrR family transcriptional regulator, repressor for neighboring sulfatase
VLEQEPSKARRGRPPNDASAPRGPEGVIDAVVEAAIAEFADGGIANVTVRQIATRAGVNPGLVHRYIGTKDDLLRLVMSRAGADLARELRAAGKAFLGRSTDDPLARYERLVAHLILEDHDLAAPGQEYPLMTYVIDRVSQESGLDDRSARLRAASIVALDMGWRLFEPLVVAATGLDPDAGDDAAMAAAVVRAREDLVSRP